LISDCDLQQTNILYAPKTLTIFLPYEAAQYFSDKETVAYTPAMKAAGYMRKSCVPLFGELAFDIREPNQ
jgi:hypothetical protein